MVVEWLTVQVEAAMQTHYLECDRAIWTQMLAAQPGFMDKQVWRNAADPQELIMVIRWTTRSHWKSIDPEVLAATEAKFVAAVGRLYPLTSTAEYQVEE